MTKEQRRAVIRESTRRWRAKKKLIKPVEDPTRAAFLMLSKLKPPSELG